MKKPSLHVTKWLGDIPVEIECRACPEWRFRATTTSHRPNREEYTRQLQQAFDQHCTPLAVENGVGKLAAN